MKITAIVAPEAGVVRYKQLRWVGRAYSDCVISREKAIKSIRRNKMTITSHYRIWNEFWGNIAVRVFEDAEIEVHAVTLFSKEEVVWMKIVYRKEDVQRTRMTPILAKALVKTRRMKLRLTVRGCSGCEKLPDKIRIFR